MPAVDMIFPAWRWLRVYRRKDLRHDVTAGLVVAVMLVPQGMAYALLAGVPPVYGLYASIVPAVVYALFGTSRHMPVGPPALMALLTFAAVSSFATPGSNEYIGLALLLALMAGVLQLGLGMLRLGFVTNFIPHPVLNGFIYASVIVIMVSQLHHLLGIPTEQSHSLVGTLRATARVIDEVSIVAVAIGTASIAVLLLAPRLTPRVPGPLMVAAASTLVVYLLRLDRAGVVVVGDVPGGLPQLSAPPLELGLLRDLLPAAMTVALVGFVESFSVAKAIASKERYKIEANQELRALGLANISAAFSSGFPVAGSFSRTAVNHQAGAKTQLAPVVTAIVIVTTLVFLTPLFRYLPNAALSAIIVVAVYRLLDLKAARRVFRINTTDGITLVVTFVLTLLLGVEVGIVAGAVFALMAFVRRTAYPEVTELGYVHDAQAFLGLRSHPDATTHPAALIIRFDAPLYYANFPTLEEWLIQAISNRPDLRYLIIDLRAVHSVDTTALDELAALTSDYHARGIHTLLTHAKLPIRRQLHAARKESHLDVGVYPTTRDATEAVGLLNELQDYERGPRES